MRDPCLGLSPALGTSVPTLTLQRGYSGLLAGPLEEQPCQPCVFTNCLQEWPPLASRNPSPLVIFQPQITCQPLQKGFLVSLLFSLQLGGVLCWSPTISISNSLPTSPEDCPLASKFSMRSPGQGVAGAALDLSPLPKAIATLKVPIKLGMVALASAR